MKKSLILGLAVLLTLTACEKIDNEVFFKVGSKLEYKFSDVELYDSSTHILYFKNVHDEFKNIIDDSFTFLVNGNIIYSGSFWPPYSSSLASGPSISSPLYGTGIYTLRIENGYSEGADIRNDSRLMTAFEEHNLLHSGLTVAPNSIEIDGEQLTFMFTVTNKDQSNLLILDLDKMGPNLFHYFTNGLSIYNLTHNEVFSSNIQHQVPESWDNWKANWLSTLKSGDSKQFTINYIIANPITPGEYNISFEFPSRYVTIDQLYQGDARIWLGDIRINQKVTIQ